MVSEEHRVTLYDFLYIDYDRVRSLYSQLFSGLLSAIENVASETISRTTDVKLGVPPLGPFSRQYDKKEIETTLDRFDPHDLILRDVLQGLVDQDVIINDATQSKPGNIILLNGRISILDFEAYRSFFEIMPHLLPATSGEEQTRTEKKQRKNLEREEKKQRESAIGILKGISEIVPWGLQVIIETDDITAWGALKAQNLREIPGNLTLKVGPTLAGRWYMLGIVDVIGSIPSEMPSQLSPQIVGLMQASHAIRAAFGRPDDQIGVTPLLIFRKLI